MNEHENLPEWIDRYNKNELHGSELKEFLALLDQNPALRKEVQLDKDLDDILSEKEIIELRKKIAKIKERDEDRGTRLIFYLLAACIIILLGLTIRSFILWNEARKKLMTPVHEFSLTDTSFRSKRDQVKPNQIEIDKATIDSAMARERRGDSSIRKRVRAMLAANYDPYPPFESLVGEVSRAGFFRLLHPTPGESFNPDTKIAFSWETESSLALTLEITDNKGHTVYQSGELTSGSLTIESLKLPPGLYYFKFLEKYEIVYFGKFNIR